MMSNQVRFMFLRNKNNQPVGCLAIKFDKSKKRAYYQVSVLNPHDRFNRSVGRELALGRLHSKPFVVVVGTQFNMHEISKAVLADIELTKSLPARAVKAASLWLNDCCTTF